MSASKKLRWGILGVAKINDRLLPGFAAARLVELRGIASRDLARARTAADRADIPTAHGSYEALLADLEIDAVYIPLPNLLHDEWTRKAADAGKHILCEKPLTTDAKSAADLVEYCRGKGVSLMDGFMWPHHPRTAKLRELIDRGDIGKVKRVVGSFTFPLPRDPSNIRLRPEMGGGSLLDVGCYPVFGIRWAFGEEPVRAFATANYENDVDVEMTAILWFADGRMATFDCGFTSPLRQWLEITGTEGVLRIQHMWLPDPQATFTVTCDDREPELARMPGHNQIANMLDDFSRAVLEKKPIHPDPSEAVKSLRVMDALARSAREGRIFDV